MPLKAYSLAGIALVFGIVTTALYFQYEERQEEERDAGFKSCQEQYAFVSPEIDCGTIDEQITQISSINNTLESFINEEKHSGRADEVSVFFRDLNTRRWFGINENINFYPASLAKLPFTMMIYKVAETNKDILNTPITLDETDIQLNTGQYYQPAETLDTGKPYPLSELLRRMLVFSDNAPVKKLMDISAPFRDPIFVDLGILFQPEAKTAIERWNITAKNYANLFRILYNISYLRPEYSNAILDELSQSTFRNTLVAGVPEGTKVSHKFGEASETDPQTDETYTVLNDCGIIYKKDEPYILCVMTQGKEHNDLERIIKTVSEEVYQSL